MHWILQTNLFNEREWMELQTTLQRLNLPYSTHKVVPFVGELIPEVKPEQEKVICFGSYSMRHTAKANNWKPGVYDLFDFDFRKQLDHWGKELLNADSIVLPFRDVKITKPMFIRPIDDTKYFSGRIFDPEDFRQWQFGLCTMEYDYGNSLTKDTLVQVSEPKEIYTEYRFWIVDGKIVTGSLYKRGTKVVYSADVPQNVIDFAKSIDMGWLPKALVLDVCETNQGMKIVEINTINSAGFYAAT